MPTFEEARGGCAGRAGRAYRRLNEWLHAHTPHPYVALGVAALALPHVIACVGILRNPTTDAATVAMTGTQLAVTFWFILRPNSGAYVIIATALVSIPAVLSTPYTFNVVALAALTFISYRRSIIGIIAGIALSICSFAAIAVNLGSPMANGGAAFFSLTVAICVCAGIIVRLRADDAASQRQNQHMRHNQDIARNLHDYTTNDLTDIMLLADQVRNANLDSATSERIRMIHESAADALRHTRQAIKTLETTQTSQNDSLRQNGRSTTGLLRIVEHYRQMLDRMDIPGDTFVLGEPDPSMTEETVQLIRHLLREMYGNIVRHADHSSPYTMMVAYTGQQTSIELSDVPKTVPEHDRDVTIVSAEDGLHSGLAYYRALILQRKGIWELQSRPYRWTLRITIPNQATSELR